MHGLQIRIASLLGIAAMTGLIAFESGTVAQHPPDRETVGDVFALAGSGKELDKVVRDLVRQLPDRDLPNRRESADTSVALASGWEAARRTAPDTLVTPDRGALCRFVGFVEGRLGVSPPIWWESGVLRAELAPETFAFFRKDTREMPYCESPFPFHLRRYVYDTSDDGQTDDYSTLMVSPTTARIREVSSGWLISVGAESLLVPQSVREEFGEIPEWASVHCGQGRMYLAFHSSFCLPFHLYCLDRQNGQVLWKCRVWANGGLYDCSGRSYHWVGIEEAGDDVLVFGLSGENAYIEGFRSLDGECRFRFGTMYGSWSFPIAK